MKILIMCEGPNELKILATHSRDFSHELAAFFV